jgi:hypothetical protein
MARIERPAINVDGISVPWLVHQGVTAPAKALQILRFASQTRRGFQFAAVMHMDFARAEPDQAGVALRTAIAAIVQRLLPGNGPFALVIEAHAARYTLSAAPRQRMAQPANFLSELAAKGAQVSDSLDQHRLDLLGLDGVRGFEIGPDAKVEAAGRGAMIHQGAGQCGGFGHGLNASRV